MKIRSRRRLAHGVPWLLALALIATACTASSTVAQTTNEDDDTQSSQPVESAESSEPVESAAPADEGQGDDDSTTTAPADDPADEGQGDDATTVAPTVAPTSEPTPEPEAATVDDELGAGEARVVVLDAGAEPRTELRLVIAASCTEVMTVTTVQEISQTIGGQQMPETGPIGNVMEMATSATPVGDNYEVRAEVISAVSTPDTPPQLAASIDAELNAIVGLTSYATLTDRAVQVPGSSRVEGAGALGPMASAIESLNQAQSPLPEEPVGVGARWETTSVLELEGLLITTIATSELVSMDGTILELRVTGTQEVDPDSRMRTQGLTGEVTLWDVTSSGTTVLDLATINPISMSLSTQGIQAFDFGAGGELEQELSTQVMTEAQPNDGCTGRTIRG